MAAVGKTASQWGKRGRYENRKTLQTTANYRKPSPTLPYLFTANYRKLPQTTANLVQPYLTCLPQTTANLVQPYLTCLPQTTANYRKLPQT